MKNGSVNILDEFFEEIYSGGAARSTVIDPTPKGGGLLGITPGRSPF